MRGVMEFSTPRSKKTKEKPCLNWEKECAESFISFVHVEEGDFDIFI